MIYDDVVVPEIPINKWVCNYSIENNNILDVYINGRLMRRHYEEDLRQLLRYKCMYWRFWRIYLELRYFNYAIGTAEIISC